MTAELGLLVTVGAACALDKFGLRRGSSRAYLSTFLPLRVLTVSPRPALAVIMLFELNSMFEFPTTA